MSLRYSDFVDYDKLDPVKRMALEMFEPTLVYPERLGIRVVSSTLGKTAMGFDFRGVVDTDFILTSNVEGLGTKNKIADEMYATVLAEKRKIADAMGEKRLYRGLGQDTVAMSVNDQLAIGADVFSYNDIISCGNSSWFSTDMERVSELLQGYRDAADAGQFAIPQGETSELRDVVFPDTLHLAGSSIGLIRPPSRHVTGDRIQIGDIIYGLESSGMHANGIAKARRITEKLKNGYFTELGKNKTVGEALLATTTLYSRAVMAMLDAGVDIHYLQPITGHGWEKIARPRKQFTYVIERLPPVPSLFRALIEWGSKNGFDMSDKENYFTWNMGIGYVIIAPESTREAVLTTARDKCGISTHILGYVAEGDRQVLMPFSENGKQVAYTP
ncbi:MAG: hypothetical protein HYW22_00890 [Candidatus Aenigmarchaeota archaeon]|nr:hypothetical protein [Candidatus Aenigmarchaeota archaeon]